ncbi:MAG TPA: Ig-like domain-containing protein [Ligilactobacillus acidipiscis]|uniref:Ig-like domain-containing protein n=1 Tax=Ligilactobacillus acidipiscis TaxID=89059 RepID=A0A921K038_9LACO|nr:Ig-like domain-containing protein [Ligilactobacillus acidipiscis]
MAEDRSEQYLKAVKDDQVVNVGAKGTKSVDIIGEQPNTKIPKGKYKTAFDNTADKNLSEIASELVDVDEFTTLSISVTGVSLDNTTLSLETGKTATLKATVSPANATNKSYGWSSSDASLATVDNAGKVTTLKAGTVKITVKTADGAKTAICTITITDPVVHVTGIDLDKATLEVEEGASATLKANVHPTEATNKAVAWKSDDTATVTVDSAGKLTGVKAKAEPVNITVTTKDGSKTAQCAVTVKAKAEEPPTEGE